MCVLPSFFPFYFLILRELGADAVFSGIKHRRGSLSRESAAKHRECFSEEGRGLGRLESMDMLKLWDEDS